jgi:hypothetical protein
MICFFPDPTTEVVKWCSGPSIESTAAEVTNLLSGDHLGEVLGHELRVRRFDLADWQ